MYDYRSDNLPDNFNSFFVPVNQKHKYNIYPSCFKIVILSPESTNYMYGKFNIRFAGAKVWNEIDEKVKSENRPTFKRKLRSDLLDSYTKFYSQWTTTIFSIS